jgi:hypothetical protein
LDNRGASSQLHLSVEVSDDLPQLYEARFEEGTGCSPVLRGTIRGSANRRCGSRFCSNWLMVSFVRLEAVFIWRGVTLLIAFKACRVERDRAEGDLGRLAGLSRAYLEGEPCVTAIVWSVLPISAGGAGRVVGRLTGQPSLCRLQWRSSGRMYRLPPLNFGRFRGCGAGKTTLRPTSYPCWTCDAPLPSSAKLRVTRPLWSSVVSREMNRRLTTTARCYSRMSALPLGQHGNGLAKCPERSLSSHMHLGLVYVGGPKHSGIARP